MPSFTIGCLGRARAGKGTIAAILQKQLSERAPVQIISFADPLKDFLIEVVGRKEPFRGDDVTRNSPVLELPWEKLQPTILRAILSTNGKRWYTSRRLVRLMTADQLRNLCRTLVHPVAPTGRQLMQGFGSECIRDGFVYDTWARIAANRAAAFDGVTIVDDVRFPNEAKPRHADGMFDLVLKVERPNWPKSTHQSEVAVDLVPDKHISAVFVNGGTIEALDVEVRRYIESLDSLVHALS